MDWCSCQSRSYPLVLRCVLEEHLAQVSSGEVKETREGVKKSVLAISFFLQTQRYGSFTGFEWADGPTLHSLDGLIVPLR